MNGDAKDRPITLQKPAVTQSDSTMTSAPKHNKHTSQGRDSPTPATQEAVPLCKKLGSKIHALRRGQPGRRRVFNSLPQIGQERLDASLQDAPIDTDRLRTDISTVAIEKNKTVLYLAYGSNLCNETFRGARGIRPLSQVNVLVPSLRLTFDLPGIPYSEPCFANTARRAPDALYDANGRIGGEDYHKDRWHKGLVGVVYEVTLSDYAHIIATEGGGSAYKDILVDCYVLPTVDTVPCTPTSKPFKAHTLFAPSLSPEGNASTTDRVTRPDSSYAQPSARYLKLITDGAAECELPTEYRDYLHQIRPYTITSKKQAMGKALFLSIWMPFLLLIFSLAKKLQDEKGRAPKWFGMFSAMVFKGMWVSYDGAFKGMFGDGERTIGDDDDDDGDDARLRRKALAKGKVRYEDAEKEGLLEEATEAIDGQVIDHWSTANRGNDIV